MSAGTLTLTNNSDLVTGVGTSFSTELTAGDFVVVIVGGVTYTLPVKSVEGNTEITLISKYPGPTQQGSAWNAVPRATQNQVTAALVVQSTEALRGLNYDKQNWQAVFSVDGHITVMLPDGSSFTGPSWLSIANILNTLDVEYLDQLAAQIKEDAQQVETDKNTVVDTAQQVSTDAQTATTAATGAQGSATDAAQSETNAEGYKELARKYALNPEDNPVTGSEYSALHYSEKARKSAEDAASHNPAEALVKSLNLSDLADRAAAWLNIRPLGSTPLAGDAVNPYDAPTLRQVENMVGGGGGVGPTLNGVQNFGVGVPTLWTSRAFIPAWAVVADGQLLNRVDWPELWAHAQMHTPVDDADWLADKTKRGNYSNGDGATTFRVPDFNGVQDGSIRGLYGRGDGGGFYVPGTVFENGAPDILARIAFRDLVNSAGAHFLGAGTDANGGAAYPPYFGQYTGNIGSYAAAPDATATRSYTVQEIAASRHNAAYSRSPLEVRGNNFAGVWIIRASGGFVAANTSWSVINSDGTAPPTTTYVSGGSLNSEYKVGTTTRYSFTSKVYGRESDPTISAAFTVADSVQSTYTDYFLKNNTVGGNLVAYVPGQTNDWNYWPNRSRQEAYFLTSDTNGPIGPGSVVFGFSMGHANQEFGTGYGLQVCGRAGNMYFRTWEANSAAWRLFTSAAVSDETLKHDITPTDGSESLANIKAMDLVKFVYNDDEQERERRGVIAQQIQTIDQNYVKKVYNGDDANPEEYTLSLDTNPLLMDALSAIKYLSQQVEELKAEVAALKGE